MRFELIDDWFVMLWRSATSWVTAFLASLVGTVGAHWATMIGILPFMPYWLQLPLGIAVGILVIWGPVMTARVTAQPKLEEKIAEKRDGTV